MKITTSAGFSLLMSIGLGGPASTRRNKAILEREANVLPFRYGSKEGSPYLAPELTCTEHELAFQTFQQFQDRAIQILTTDLLDEFNPSRRFDLEYTISDKL